MSSTEILVTSEDNKLQSGTTPKKTHQEKYSLACRPSTKYIPCPSYPVRTVHGALQLASVQGEGLFKIDR